MKILTIIYNLGLGGTQRAALNYSLGYHNHGAEVKVLWLDSAGPYTDVLKGYGIQVCEGGQLLDASLEKLRAWSSDVIHVHRWGDSDSNIASVLRHLKSTSTLVLETNVFSRPDDSADASLTDIHFHLSRWCLWKWSMRPGRRRLATLACVVPYIVNCEPFYRLSNQERSRARDKWDLPQKAFVFGRIGQPSMGKWSKKLVEYFEKALANNDNLSFLLVAPPPQIERQLQSSTPQLRRRTKIVRMVDSDRDLLELYNCMDAFVHHAQIGESFGMVLAEAMLTGCPVVTRSTPRADNSQLEVVPHLEGGIVVADDAAMVTAMRRLSEDVLLHNRLSDHAPTVIRNRYSSDVMIPKVMKIIRILQESSYFDWRKKALLNGGVDLAIDHSELVSLMKACEGTYSFKDWLFMTFPRQYQNGQEMAYRVRDRLKDLVRPRAI